jgi:outer membrane receptor protein involved in Fe transport
MRILLCVLSLVMTAATAMAQTVVTGVVRDGSGGVVPNAAVTVRAAGGGQRQAVTGPDGRFSVEAPGSGEVTLTVRAGGFAEKRQTVSGGEVDVVLSPAGLLETVMVTPTRSEQRLGDVPASVSILTADDIRRSPAVVADDVLRQVPTFSLFRRSSSLTAQPTTQGVSLRGIGPSGVSRTLVLLDGVPFNDPFGGWVYWTRVPMENVDRIEIVEGPSSNLYGNYAMGGVINLMSTPAVRRNVEAKVQYGNLNTPKFDMAGSDVWGKVSLSVQGSMFETDGFNNVSRAERGPVDVPANVSFRQVSGKMDYAPTSKVRTFARLGYFSEERSNGKITTVDAIATPEANDTTWTSVNGGVRMELPDSSSLQATVFGDFNTFHANFLAVPNLVTRAIARVTLDQNVPTHQVGGNVTWSRAAGTKNYFTVGTDYRWVDGDSEEAGFDAVVGRTQNIDRRSGGTQRSTGAFIQDVLTPISQVTITAGVRFDNWRNYDAHNLEYNVPAGTPTANNVPSLPERSDSVVSPRVAVMYRITDKVNAWGSVSRGFRAPTLNELYRQFRVGAILTQANPALGPERLTGGEFGVNLLPTSNTTVRATWYDNRIENPVANVTLTAAIRQRQNLGRTRVRGFQTDVDYRLGTSWRAGAAYVYNSARVTEYNPTPAPAISLVGNFLPQVPKHRGSAQLIYSNPRFATIAADVEVTGRQFEDDQNLLTVPAAALADAGYDVTTMPGLPGFTMVNLSVSSSFTSRAEVFVGAQNLLNQTFFVGLLPTTIGQPRLFNGGVRVHLGR